MGRLSHYAASKWGLTGLTKSWAIELAPHGIRVVSIHPTGVNTPMNDGLAALEGLTPQEIAERSAGNLLPVPWIEPEDVAVMGETGVIGPVRSVSARARVAGPAAGRLHHPVHDPGGCDQCVPRCIRKGAAPSAASAPVPIRVPFLAALLVAALAMALLATVAAGPARATASATPARSPSSPTPTSPASGRPSRSPPARRR